MKAVNPRQHESSDVTRVVKDLTRLKYALSKLCSLIMLSCFLVSSLYSQHDSTSKTEINTEERVLSYNNYFFKLDSIKRYYHERYITSSCLSKQNWLLSTKESSEKLKFGTIDILKEHPTDNNLFIAQLVVTYKNKDWKFQNKDQRCRILVVVDSSFLYNPLKIQIGSTFFESGLFKFVFSKDSLKFYRVNDIGLVLRMNKNTIERYAVFQYNEKVLSQVSFVKRICTLIGN
ncbi:MAG: hypothetical protein U0Y96_07745 [Candidatus Kapaibacterium sp.]